MTMTIAFTIVVKVSDDDAEKIDVRDLSKVLEGLKDRAQKYCRDDAWMSVEIVGGSLEIS